MNRFWAAVRFLTVVPVPWDWGTGVEDLARSKPFFPLVGCCIGGVAGGLAWVGGVYFPDLFTGVVVTICLMAASGGLHMDGLSDTADGVLSARPRERMLEIMRDSHIGAMGVMAIVGVFSLKVAALSGLPPDLRWRSAFLMPVAGRCALVVSMAVLPYARPDGGLGTVFFQRARWFPAIWSVLFLAAIGWLVAGQMGLVIGLASVLGTLVFSMYIFFKIGGATGDTLGATCEVVECLAPVLFLCWAH